MANKELASLLIENNIVKKQKKQGKKINALLKSETKTGLATNITDDLGDLRIGNLLCAASGYPDDGTFTGTFISLEGFVINGTVYHIGGMYQGTLMWAGNSTTGEFEFIGGNAKINADGIVGTDLLKWMIKQDATNDVYTRYGKLGLALKEGGGSIPIWQLSYSSPDGAEVMSNGGFESGDLTNWTETAGNWSTTTSMTIYPDTTNPYEGTYLAYSEAEISQILTSDKYAVAGANNYKIALSVWNLLPVQSIKAEIKFYTAGDVLVGSPQVLAVLYGEGLTITTQWELFSEIINTPETATKAEIVITGHASATTIIIVDNVSITPISVNQKLWLEDEGAECTNGLYPTEINLWGYDVTTLNSSDAAVTTYLAVDTAQYFNYVAGIANSDANNGDKYIWNNWTAKAGTYTLRYLGKRGTSFGKFDVYIDDVLVSASSTDCYGSSANNQLYSVANLDIAYHGVHKLELRINGKHASSSDYTLLMTKLNLRRTGD